MAQTIGDYRSRQSGNWHTATTWQVFNTGVWNNLESAAAGGYRNIIPSNIRGVLEIRSGHVVTVAAALTADQLVIRNGGQLFVGGAVLTLANGPSGVDLTVEPAGLLRVSGYLITSDGATFSGTSPTNTLFLAGSNYRHLFKTTEGSLPLATWDVTSTMAILGYTASINASVAGNWSQPFGNVVFDCQLAFNTSVNMNGLLNNIQGNLTVSRTGGTTTTSYLSLSNTQVVGITIGGDLLVSNTARFVLNRGATGNCTLTIGGNFLFTSTNTSGSYFSTAGATTVTIQGDLIMNAVGGMFYAAGPNSTCTINLVGNVTQTTGGFSQTGTGASSTLNFSGVSQNLTTNFTFAGGGHYVVRTGTTLNLTTFRLISSATGNFTLENGATLRVGSTEATGAIGATETTGNLGVPNARRFFNATCRIVYDGTAAQFIGAGHPTSVNLTTEIQNPAGVSLAANVTIGGSLILTSGSLNLLTRTLFIGGNFADNATLTAGTGTVTFNGTTTQSILGSSLTTFQNLTIANTTANPGVQIQTNKNLRGILTLSPGARLDADGSANTTIFTLLSTADAPAMDAAIAALSGGAQVQGRVTVQRHMSIEGGTNLNGRIYRYISSPVQGATVQDIQGELPVTGSFTGASGCAGCQANIQSMFSYRESVITDINKSGGNDVNDGYVDFPFTSNLETLATGLGYTIFVRGDIPPVSTVGHARWDVRNPINAGTVNFSSLLSYTASGNNTNDGWNLVGNPYPCTIDWNAASGWTKTGITNTIYMNDNGSNPSVYATFNGTVGTNGGSRYIPLGQAFFVKSDGGPINFQLTESVKAPGVTTTFFRESEPSNVLRITLRNDSLRDESVIHFRNDATTGYDSQIDAYKLKNSTLNLSSALPDGTQLAINSMPRTDCRETIQLNVSDVRPGSYALNFSGLGSFDETSFVSLTDSFLGKTVSVVSDESYAFLVTDDPESYGAQRFSIVLSKGVPPQLELPQSQVTCTTSGARVQINDSRKGYMYALHRETGVIAAVEGNGAPLELIADSIELHPGVNEFRVVAQSTTCPGIATELEITIQVEDMPQATIDSIKNLLASNYNLGNTWYFQGQVISRAPTIEITEPGTYELVVEKGNCTSNAMISVDQVFPEVQNVGYEVYPNPVKKGQLLTVKLKDFNGNTVKVRNSTGMEVGTIMFATNSETGSHERVGKFDFNRLPQGIYYLQFKLGSVLHSVKILSLY